MTARAFTGGWLVAAAVLSSWAVSSASDPRQDRAREGRAAEPAAPSYRLPALSVEVDAEVARLAGRAQTAALDAAPKRNLFSFAATAAREPRAVPPRAADAKARADAAPLAAPQPAPAPSLSGIADTRAGVLTAVISFRGELHYVKKDDVIAARYRVDAISVDGVELFDVSLGTILRLSLQRLS